MATTNSKERREAAEARITDFFEECEQGLWDRDHFIETWQLQNSGYIEDGFDRFNSPMPPDADEMGVFDEIREDAISGLASLWRMIEDHTAYDREGNHITGAISKETMIPLYAAQLRALPDDKLVMLVAQLAGMVSDFERLSESLNPYDEPNEFFESYYKRRIIEKTAE